MKKTATQAGSGQQSKPGHSVPASSQPVWDKNSAEPWIVTAQRDNEPSEPVSEQSQNPSGGGGGETAKAEPALHCRQVRESEAWGGRRWRAQLRRLEPLDLPLLAIGADGADGRGKRKAPANLRNGSLLSGWQTAKHTVGQIECAHPKVICAGTRTGKDAHGLVAFDLDGETAVSWCLERGCDPELAQTWQVRRNTDASRLKVLFRLTEEQQQQLGQTKTKAETKAAIKDAKGKTIEAGEAVELFHGVGQVIVVGQHNESKGHYFWPDGRGPEALALIPPCWWDAALEIVNPTTAALSASKPGRNASSGQWHNLTPCPICGRPDGWCQQTTDERPTVKCMHGESYSPPSGLKPGELHTDSEGTVWAFSSSRQQSDGESYSVFVTPDPDKCKTVGSGHKPRDEAAVKGWNQLLTEMLQAVVAGDDDTAMALRADAITRFRRSDAQVDAALFKLHTARELQREVNTPPESLDLSRLSGMDWLVDGFIPDNDQTLLYGAAGTGKTTAALALACAVLRGTGFLDRQHPARQTGVLFIASDSGATPLHAAMQDMGMADMPEVTEGPGKRFHVWASDPDQGMTAWGADLSGCIRLLQFIQRHQIGLVLIDSCKAACSGAGLDYMNNQLVTELLTHFKEVICPHAAVVWLTHDGVARDAHAGAKAWKEVPSMVHMLKGVDEPDGKPSNSQRWWGVIKSRMGPTRQFKYAMADGNLAPVQGMEIVGNCLARVVEVLAGALQLQGIESLSRGELQARICMAGGPSRKTLDNTLTTACRARHPEIVRVSSKRGHYKLAPRVADLLKGCIVSGREQVKNLDSDWNLSSSRQVPAGTSPRCRSHANGSQGIVDQSPAGDDADGVPDEFPWENDGKSPNASGSSGSGQVPSQCACTPTEPWRTRAAELHAEGKHYHSIALELEVESGIRVTGREVKAALT